MRNITGLVLFVENMEFSSGGMVMVVTDQVLKHPCALCSCMSSSLSWRIHFPWHHSPNTIYLQEDQSHVLMEHSYSKWKALKCKPHPCLHQVPNCYLVVYMQVSGTKHFCKWCNNDLNLSPAAALARSSIHQLTAYIQLPQTQWT